MENPSAISLGFGLESWESEGDAALLERWIREELDAAGAPLRLPLRDWAPALDAVKEAKVGRPGWPSEIDARILDFVRMLLRFSRPDGSTVAASGVPPRVRAFWRSIVRTFPAADVERVLGWWYPEREAEPVPPPLPTWSATDRVQGVLRADWTPRGDLLAFDHREGPDTLLDVYGSGRTWLGPNWSMQSGQLSKPPQLTAWGSNSTADVAEWSIQSARGDVVRLALMLRGRRMALLADFWDEAQQPSMMIDLAEGLTSNALEPPGAWTLRPARTGRSAQVVLLTNGASIKPDASGSRLNVESGGESRWLPLLISWNHPRHRVPLTWTELTVAEQGKPCPPGTAWAARVSWGRDQSYVFYRSLGPPARRSFLGCSTTARMFVGRFSPEGDVEPLVTLA